MRWTVLLLLLLIGPAHAAYAPDTVAVTDSNATLRNIPTSAVHSVLRLGFAAPGDTGGPLMFTASNAVCPLNGGNGDGGSQVKSLDGKCWIADFSGTQPTPKQWGCVGNGAANDQSCLQAAVSAMANKTLYCGPYTYGVASAVTISSPLVFEGINENTTCLRQLTANIDLLKIVATTYTEIRQMKIDGGGGSTSGSAIYMPGGDYANRVDRVHIENGCIGIDLQGNDSSVHNSRINGVPGSACYGIRVGHNMSGSSNTGPRIVDTTVAYGAAAGAAVLVEDSGGLQIVNGNFLGGLYGFKVFPGNCTGGCYPSNGAQQSIWGTITNTYLGDVPSVNAALFIDTAFAGAKVAGWVVSNSWVASASAGPGISINNTAGGYVSGITFSTMRVYGNKTNGLEINAGAAGVSVVGSRFCGNNTANTANGTANVKLASGVNSVSVTGSLLGGSCDGSANVSPEFSVALGGNDFGQVLNPAYVGGTPTGGSTVANNTGLDSYVPVLPVSSNILRLGANASSFVATGTVKFIYNGASGTVGGWNERKVTLYSSGGSVVYDDTGGGGGSICSGNGVVTVPNFNAAALQYNSTNFCWTVVR
jgi:hypothetical protein